MYVEAGACGTFSHMKTENRRSYGHGWDQVFKCIEEDHQRRMKDLGVGAKSQGDSFERVSSQKRNPPTFPPANKYRDYREAKALYGPKRGCPM